MGDPQWRPPVWAQVWAQLARALVLYAADYHEWWFKLALPMANWLPKGGPPLPSPLRSAQLQFAPLLVLPPLYTPPRLPERQAQGHKSGVAPLAIQLAFDGHSTVFRCPSSVFSFLNTTPIIVFTTRRGFGEPTKYTFYNI